MSKAYVSCDMEGSTGIVNNDYCNPEGKFYNEGKRYMTNDLKAVIAGLQNGGAEHTVVNDSHWNMTNLRIEDLPRGVDLISGGTKIDSMVEGLDGTFDAVVFVGYHPMWGTERGVIAHTFSGSIMEVTLNETPVGESAIMGFAAGSYGVPLIFVSGDDLLMEEIRGLSEEIHFVVTKEGITKYAARLYDIERVHGEMTKQAEMAWENRKNISPLKPPEPALLAVRFKETQMADMCMRVPGVHRKDNLTVAYEHDDYLTVFRTFMALTSIGTSAKS